MWGFVMPDSKVADHTLKVTPGKPVILPPGENAANAEFTRDGQDLCLTTQGHTTRIEGYFAHDPSPDVVTADGASHFTPKLIGSFLPPQHPGEYAEGATHTASDATGAVGRITKLDGEATIIHPDGTKVKAEVGSMVHMGDVVTTGKQGSVNILFADNTSFSISRNAKLAIDEFTYNPQEHEGTSYFSMLQGVFVYQSGDIGKDDPSKVNINTPVGSIGIRGTLVAGEINPAGQESKITIVDGAVIITNGGGELVLNDAFETATLTGFDAAATNAGQLDSNSFATTYSAVAPVATSTFSAVSNGTYSTVTPAPAPAPQEGTTQQTTQPGPGDGMVTQPAPDGSVAPTPPGAVMPAPTDGALPPPPGSQLAPDGSVTPPPAPPQDGMLQTLPGTQPVPGITPVAGTEGALPPPPTGSTFTDPAGSAFPSPTGSGFTQTTTSPTGVVSTTTTTPPPPPPPPPSTGGTVTGGTAPPPPSAQFIFAPVYLNNTPGDTSDDGIPVFGVGLNASVANPVMIGQLLLNDFQSAPTVTITGTNYNAGTGVFSGTTLEFASPTLLGNAATNQLTSQPIMSFNAAGQLMLTDPTGLLTNLNGPGYFDFSVTVTSQDALGNTITHLNQNVFVQVKQDVGTGPYTIYVGDHSAASANINDPAQVPRVDAIVDGTGDDLLIAGEGTQASPLFGNILRSSNGGHDVLVGGSGRDLLKTEGGTNSSKMYGMGGDDEMHFTSLSFLPDAFSKVDGGAGMDTLVVGPLGFTGGLTFDFRATNNVANIEKLLLEGGTTIANHLALDARDVFEMSGANHVLKIGMAGSGLATFDLGNTGSLLDFTYSSANAAQNTVTYTGVFNSQTVTLIIEQNNSPVVNLV
jgi:hypothetical protein